MLSDEYRYKILKQLNEDPNTSQRDLARCLGVSVGKINFCINALVEKGYVKVKNFRRHGNKLAYAYLLTPRGIDERARVTVDFLRSKMAEFENLQQEIEALRAEVGNARRGASPDAPE